MTKVTGNWREYQTEVAEFFRSIGLNASIEQKVAGARGIHNIDVWVTFKRYGFEIKWVVECKFWKSTIPKEKILALHQIVQDVGADRGILLAESGFQAGAIIATKNTSITLTSLDEIRSNANEEIISLELTKINKRIGYLDARLSPFVSDSNGTPFPMSGIGREEIISIMGDLFSLKLASQKGLAEDFPVWHLVEGASTYSQNAYEFCENAVPTLDLLGEKIEMLYSKASEIEREKCSVFTQLDNAVERLVIDAEAALFTSSEESTQFESNRLKALSSMKEVGRLSEKAKPFARSNLETGLRALMRLLIDTVYQHLTEPTIPLEIWNETKMAVEESLTNIRETLAT
jgi:hypothetical protein